MDMHGHIYAHIWTWTYVHIWANIRWVKIESTVHLDHNKTTILCDKTQFHIYTSEFHRKATHVKCLATEVKRDIVIIIIEGGSCSETEKVGLDSRI